MWTAIGIIAASLAILAIDGPRIRKMRPRRDFIVFSVFLLLGTGLSIIEFATHLELPNPSDLLIVVYKPVHHVITSLL